MIRLENICGIKIADTARKSILDLADHRNKLIHFYHESYTANISDNTLAEVVAEQCLTWKHLHELVFAKWAKDFGLEVLEELQTIDQSLHANRRFLAGKFAGLANEIADRKGDGPDPVDCPACGFSAFFDEPLGDDRYIGDCLVCRYGDVTVAVSCPQCESEARFSAADELKCPKCEKAITVDLMLELFGDKRGVKEKATEPWPIACVDCGDGPIIKWRDDWLCLYCMEIQYETSTCDRCGVTLAGFLEDSYQFGCRQCDGRTGAAEDD